MPVGNPTTIAAVLPAGGQKICARWFTNNSTVSVSTAGQVVANATVNLTIMYPNVPSQYPNFDWTEGLVIYLISPSGTTVTLSQFEPSSGYVAPGSSIGFVNPISSDSASTAIFRGIRHNRARSSPRLPLPL